MNTINCANKQKHCANSLTHESLKPNIISWKVKIMDAVFEKKYVYVTSFPCIVKSCSKKNFSLRDNTGREKTKIINLRYLITSLVFWEMKQLWRNNVDPIQNLICLPGADGINYSTLYIQFYRGLQFPLQLSIDLMFVILCRLWIHSQCSIEHGRGTNLERPWCLLRHTKLSENCIATWNFIQSSEGQRRQYCSGNFMNFNVMVVLFCLWNIYFYMTPAQSISIKVRFKYRPIKRMA